MGPRLLPILTISMALVSFRLPASSQISGTANLPVAPCRTSPCGPAGPLPSYTAEFKVTQVQTLANGTTISRETTRVQAHDSEGRTMNSTKQLQPFGNGEEMNSVFVSDPKAGTQINWNSRSKRAMVIVFPTPEQRHGCWRSESGNVTANYGVSNPFTVAGVTPASAAPLPNISLRPKPVIEDLGTTMVAGVEAHGTRRTTTIPAGEVGNDQPLTAVQESWLAPSLGLVVRSVRDDPRTGKETLEPVNITLGEPDPSLFLPPKDFELVTQTMVPCKDQR